MMRTASIKLDARVARGSEAALARAAIRLCERLPSGFPPSFASIGSGIGWHCINGPIRICVLRLRWAARCAAMPSFRFARRTRRHSKVTGRIPKDTPVPAISFQRASVHFDKRTYALKKNAVSLYTLGGRVIVPMRLGEHQRRILSSGRPKEAELVFRKGNWYFNLVGRRIRPTRSRFASGPGEWGVDVGPKTNLAGTHSLVGDVRERSSVRSSRDQASRPASPSSSPPRAAEAPKQRSFGRFSGKERAARSPSCEPTRRSKGHRAGRRSRPEVAKIIDGARPDAYPRPDQGWQAHARKIASLGLPAAPTLCRVQGEIGRHRGRIRRSGLHEPNLLVL